MYLSSEVYVYLSSEVVKDVSHLNPAHIGLQQDLLKLETLPPAITSSVNLTTSARFAKVIEVKVQNIQEPGESESVI